MTLKELHCLLEEIATIPGSDKMDFPVVIQTVDGLSPDNFSVELKSVMLGFDWSHGKIVLIPNERLRRVK